MPKITINNKEIEFKPGQTVIQVAEENEIPIPHFCWHPALSVSGNCRMCLVEVEKMPKLVIACSTLASDGMVVHVESEKAITARNAVMEFLLINHPLDCPICDEAGECKLQDYTYKYSVGENRFNEDKQHKPKRVELGPHVMLDVERCIACSRCIRFCDEIAKENQLTFSKRGDRVTITAYPGKQMDNPYSLNTTDICPVGALTNKEIRFNTRVWDMSRTNSICTGCSRGCNDEIWVKDNKIIRLTPRYNQEVNSYWMCDNGRLNSFRHVNENRVDSPLIKKDGELKAVTYEEAFSKIISGLQQFNKNEIAFLGSSFASCEDNYLLGKIAKTVLGCNNTGIADHIIAGNCDNILLTEDKSPNTLGAELVGIKSGNGGMAFSEIMNSIAENKIKVLYCLEDDIAELDQTYPEVLAKLKLLIIHSLNLNKTTQLADIVLPASSFAEKNGTMVNVNGRMQRIKPAVVTKTMERSFDNMSLSRLDKFGTEYDRWNKGNRVDAKPSWMLIQSLANLMGAKWKYENAEDVFDSITKSIDIFCGLDYETIGENGIQLNIKKQQKILKQEISISK